MTILGQWTGLTLAMAGLVMFNVGIMSVNNTSATIALMLSGFCLIVLGGAFIKAGSVNFQ